MSERAISELLLSKGQTFLKAPRTPYSFTGIPEADALLNDLSGHPHAFVLACVMDRQIQAERAWLIPYRFSERLGGFSMEALEALSPDAVRTLMLRPKPLHRFGEKMSKSFHLAIQRIVNQYDGDAARIWNATPPSAEVVHRFLQFHGIGPKIGTMAANLLARNFKIRFEDYADVHIRRVFGRLGLCAPGATDQQVVYKARSLNPEFPGLLDWPCFDIGRQWCKATDPLCDECYMCDVCPTAAGRTKAK